MKHKYGCVCGVHAFTGGSTTAERNWLRQRLSEFVVKIPGKKKPKFQYKLPLIGDTCRPAWILAAGFPTKKNSRIAILEAEIRNPALRKAHNNGASFLGSTSTIALTRSQFAVAFLEEYILKHSQRSPSSTDL